MESMNAGRTALNDALWNNPKKMDSLFKYGVGMMNPTMMLIWRRQVKMRECITRII